jgi:hypothetical protein
MTQGVGAQASIGILFSYGGDDTFASRSVGFSSPAHDYHPPASGGNFSFLINYGGENKFGNGTANNSYVQRGTAAGFLIQRPTEKEAGDKLMALRQAVVTRNQEIAEYDAKVAQLKEEAAAKRQRYLPPRQRRPIPISEGQLLTAVPDFDHTKKISAAETETNVQ